MVSFNVINHDNYQLYHEVDLNDFQDFVDDHIESTHVPIPVIIQKAEKKTWQSIVLKLK